jgi:hypothetical protein
LGGVTATLLRDHPAPVLLSAAAVAYAGLFFLLPLLAGDRLDASLRVMCSAIAAPFFLDAVRRIGWARRAGVRLTATEVIVRDWGQTRRLRWSDLRVVFPARILRYRMVVLVATTCIRGSRSPASSSSPHSVCRSTPTRWPACWSG